MSNSPYLSQELKDYLAKHKIEETLTNAVNELMNKKLDDPYAFFMNTFGQLASSEIKIAKLSAFQIMNTEQLPTIKCKFTVEYKLKTYELVLDPVFVVASEGLPILYDEAEDQFGGKGMTKAIQVINNQVDNLIKGKICSDQANIDESLLTFYDQMEKKALNCVQVISYCIPHVLSRIQHVQLYQIFQNITGLASNPNPPKVMINLLQAGKGIHPKCKAYKYILLVNKYDSAFQLLDIVTQICQNVRKTITSGKQGEAALKFYVDGSFICPMDTIMDNLKLVEEAINKSNYKDNVGVGISFMADSLYNPDQKKYELENPKQLLDVDQMIDYYIKLATDKPVVQYIEDGLNTTDMDNWKKMIDKLSAKNIMVGSRKIYNTAANIKKLTNPLSQEESQGKTPQEVEQYNANRIHINCAVVKPFEYPTLTKFLEIAKLLTNKKPATQVVISDNLNECTDTTLIDLAFSISGSYLSFAPPVKYERQLKFNRIIEIMNQLASQNEGSKQ